MRAADIMTRNVVSVSPETPASHVVRLCLTQGRPEYLSLIATAASRE
jgi:CBS-domain-containing membrane protein